MNLYDIISPYWGIRTSLAIGSVPAVKAFMKKGSLSDADRLQIICDFFWEETLSSKLDDLLEVMMVQRETFWLSESVGLDNLPFQEDDLCRPRLDKPMSARLSRSLAVRDWCFKNRYRQPRLRKRLKAETPNYSLEWLICPYDPAVMLLFNSSIPEEYKEHANTIRLFWYYLINENGGQSAWNLLTRRVGTLTLFQEWSEIRTRIGRNLLSLLEQRAR